jgi:hypothetical protein
MLLSVLLLFVVALLPQHSLASLRKKICNPRKKIKNLNGFKHRYLNVLKVPYIVCILHCPERVHPHGHDTLLELEQTSKLTFQST